jgi:hypothetical protein
VYSSRTAQLRFCAGAIGEGTAIEIGAGHGVLAKALGIFATDNRQQEEAGLKAHYASLGQPIVPYGANVEKLDAAAAMQKHQPQVVIACWVTHLYDPQQHEREGSETGVDEAAVIEGCEEYIFIGNEHVHALKPIWALPHEVMTPPWLFSRAANGSKDFIAIWKRGVPKETGPAHASRRPSGAI